MDIILSYPGVPLMGVTVVNYFMSKSPALERISKIPSLKAGYDKILKAILIYGTIPWFILGIGNLTGQTNTVFDYFIAVP